MCRSGLCSIVVVVVASACDAQAAVSQVRSASGIPDCQQSPGATTRAGDGWASDFEPQQLGMFSQVQFAATPGEPSHGPIDAVIGLANGPATRFTDLGPVVRFNPAGRIDARDGAAYRADVDLPYATDGTQYLVHLFINFSAHTYTVTIGHFNDPFPVTIATDYAFRSEQAMMSRSDNLGREVDSSTGSVAICSYAASAQEHDSSAGSGWDVTPMRSESGRLQVDVEAIARGTSVDAVVGLAATAPARFTDLAAIARFSPAGVIDARDGDAYRADTVLAYVPNETYHFVFDVDVPARRYSVTVVDSGNGQRTQIATDYAFRTEQQGVASLGALGQFVDGTTGGVSTAFLLETY
jgi:hypothetical protein